MSYHRLDPRTAPARAWPPFVSASTPVACAAGDVNPDLFFPDPGTTPGTALRVCAHCPVRRDCLAWAMETEQRHGVWGGTTAAERARLGGWQ